MLYDAIDSVFLAVPDLEATSRPYERLGLRLTPAQAGRRTLICGGPGNLFAVHFLDATQDGPLAGQCRQALAAGRALFAIALRVADLAGAVRPLAVHGIQATVFSDGDQKMAWLPLHNQAGTDLVLVQHAQPGAERHAAAQRAGLLGHSLGLKRLDHLAAVTPDLEVKTRFWLEVLGVPAAGEVVTPALVIRQLRIGDAVLELLGPGSPDSPIWKRAPGLVSMVSWEVPDLEEAVRHARAAGFTVPDPAAGPLPGTRITTVPGTELAGVNLQLLEYA